LSTELFQEGIIIPPIKLVDGGRRNKAVWQLILRNVRTPSERDGDLAAQLAAHAIGQQRLIEIVQRYGLEETLNHAHALIDYAKRLTRTAVSQIPDGRYVFRDFLDDDGQAEEPLPIQVAINIDGQEMHVNFAGTAPAVRGNLNTVPAIVESAVAYCLRCVALALLETNLPMNQGAFDPIHLSIPPGSLLDPLPPHAVAAGNVETSQRIVDVVFGALAQALPHLIPASSQGTMNNLTFGGVQTDRASDGRVTTSSSFAYLSNTLNTPVEALEYSFPLRVTQYSQRQGSGGKGKFNGGNGLVRSIQFLCPVTATIMSERRQRPPFGLNSGKPGATGRNSLERQGKRVTLPGKVTLDLEVNDILCIETPGGGGWGTDSSE
jgi:N-methylhydantoinase B